MMRIIIKELINNKNYFNNLNPVGKKIYAFKEKFLRMRLAILNFDMINEELMDSNIFVSLCMEGNTVYDLIETKGYSKLLTDKITESLKKETTFFEETIYGIKHSALN